MKDLKIAIVYDWIDSWGGVERVLLILSQLFPQATFFTSYVNPDKATWSTDLDIKTSFIQNLPSFIKDNRARSVILYPFAFESFYFSSFDLVLSITSSFAKGVITLPEVPHICYLLSPTRFLWLYQDTYVKENVITSPIVRHLKQWDTVAATRPDRIISISNTVKTRAEKIYGRESRVIYPPFDLSYWEKIESRLLKTKSSVSTPNDYYLVVSRLEPYKHIDIVIQLFKELKNKKLIVVGAGTQEKKLQEIISNNIAFRKNVSDQELAQLYIHAQALLMPQEEDFGITALEAQFFECPVIAYNKGGGTETILDNKTGIFFDQQTTSSLSKTLEKFEQIAYTLKESLRKNGKKNVERFDRQKFASELIAHISDYLIQIKNK